MVWVRSIWQVWYMWFGVIHLTGMVNRTFKTYSTFTYILYDISWLVMDVNLPIYHSWCSKGIGYMVISMQKQGDSRFTIFYFRDTMTKSLLSVLAKKVHIFGSQCQNKKKYEVINVTIYIHNAFRLYQVIFRCQHSKNQNPQKHK